MGRPGEFGYGFFLAAEVFLSGCLAVCPCHLLPARLLGAGLTVFARVAFLGSSAFSSSWLSGSPGSSWAPSAGASFSSGFLSFLLPAGLGQLAQRLVAVPVLGLFTVSPGSPRPAGWAGSWPRRFRGLVFRSLVSVPHRMAGSRREAAAPPGLPLRRISSAWVSASLRSGGVAGQVNHGGCRDGAHGQCRIPRLGR